MKKKKNNPQQKRKCVLCGRSIPMLDNNVMVGSTGRIVCYDCLRVSRMMQAVHNKTVDPRLLPEPEEQIQTPRDIITALDRSIIGQTDAKAAIALAMWKQMNRANGDKHIPKPNLMLVGPTGCGKTAMLQAAAKIVDLPFMIFDTPSFTQAGYRGRDVEEIIQDLCNRYGSHKKLNSAVIFLDEFDKIAATAGNEHLAAYNKGTQHAFLKIVEGTEIMVDDKPFDTSGLLFIFGGAFTGLRQNRKTIRRVGPIGFGREEVKDLTDGPVFTISDLTSYGMEPELLGRVGQIVTMNELTEQELLRVLFESELSVFRQYEKFFSNRGIELKLPRDTAEEIAHAAYERGTGARGLNVKLEERIAPILMQYANGTIPSVVHIR